jgi:hypothetical protein
MLPPMERFRSGKGLALASTILLSCLALLSTIQGAGWLHLASVWRDFTADRRGIAESIDATQPLVALLVIATAVVFCCWIYRATANLKPLGSLGCTFTPSAAVWSYFIPVVSLVRGHQAMANVWRESQPAAMNESGYLLPRTVGIVNLWWALWLGGNLASIAFGVAIGQDFPSRAYSEGFFKLVHAAAATTAALMIHRANARQDAQADDLARRASQPEMTGMELR